jgi:hypothetical protein
MRIKTGYTGCGCITQWLLRAARERDAMYCPKCRVEYREGFDRCSDCGTLLVAELPPEPQPEYVDLVTVLSAPDGNIVAVAKSLLESAGIRCIARGEGLQELFAGGRIGAGFNPAMGPVEIQVLPEDEVEARRILESHGGFDTRSE